MRGEPVRGGAYAGGGVTSGVRRVVVVGRDAALWLTALALHRALGRTGVAVEAVELPSLLREVDVYSAVPSLAGLHRLLGFDEAALLRACSGVPVLGQRFAGWSRSHPDFIHAYDTGRIAFDDVDFLQYWISARGQGLKVAFEDFSPGAAAAKQGRVAAPDAGPGALPPPASGRHLDAKAYADFAKRRALAGGVMHRSGMLASVDRMGDRIAAMTLEGGDAVTGDLFIDASGSEAALIGDMPGAEFESWSEWLGVDRVVASSAPALRPMPAFAQIAAFSAGWIGLFPLRDRTGVIMSFKSGPLSDEDMLRAAAGITGLRPEGDAVAAPLAPGMRRRSWIGNCVAIGDAAAALEPLDAVQLHFIHVGISNLVALFPVSSDRMPEAQAYSDAVARHASNVRDFQIAHYRLNGRVGEPFWDGARAAVGPPGLDAKIGLFASRGLVSLYDDEAFQEQNWAANFIGHGLIPRAHDPLVDRMPPEEQIESIKRLLGSIAHEVRTMPTIEAYPAAGAAPYPARPA